MLNRHQTVIITMWCWHHGLQYWNCHDYARNTATEKKIDIDVDNNKDRIRSNPVCVFLNVFSIKRYEEGVGAVCEHVFNKVIWGGWRMEGMLVSLYICLCFMCFQWGFVERGLAVSYHHIENTFTNTNRSCGFGGGDRLVSLNINIVCSCVFNDVL